MRLVQPSTLALGLVTTAGLAAAQAQFLVSELSFGHTGRINDRGQATVPSFSIQGTPDVPEVLSNKVILTPPHPGNTRGAAWGDNTNQYRTWAADVDFRVSGPERGSGNLNIWLARRGNDEIGQSSIYTVGKFDGLALVIDNHGGTGGMIRGFLNDGTTDYKSQASVDSLAFGHCSYNYRNLGRPSQIKLKQTAQTFRVEIDSRLCFETDQISLPAGYNFGVTAASADNPDSIEVFKLVVMTEDLNAKSDERQVPPQQQQQYGGQQQQMFFGRSGQNDGFKQDNFDDDVADADADAITSSKAQFADLHNRLQSVNHHLATVFRSSAQHAAASQKRDEEAMQVINDLKQTLSKLDRLNTIDNLMNDVKGLQNELRNTKNELNNKLRETENGIKKYMGANHGNMLEHVATSQPGHGKLIFVIIGSQVVLVCGYIYYERKKTSPKKYL
ncbi:concanavalin A-like lectin/glucanase [Xylariaceae sp. FL1019]|nr:concanavalin A-like lectin/glucanase [Xylariaceae sp. FL1019]